VPVFAAPEMADSAALSELAETFPSSVVVGYSTSGEISARTWVLDKGRRKRITSALWVSTAID